MKTRSIFLSLVIILFVHQGYGQCVSNWEGFPSNNSGNELIASDMEGNIFTVKEYYADAIGICENGLTLNSSNSKGFVIIKTDNNLNSMWLLQNTGADFDFFHAQIATDLLGNLYIAVNGSGNLIFGEYNSPSIPELFVSIFKINPDGNILWMKTAKTTGVNLNLQDMDVNNNGEIALLCTYDGGYNLVLDGNTFDHSGINTYSNVHRLVVFSEDNNNIFTDYSGGSYSEEIMGTFDDIGNYYVMDNGYYQTIFFGNASYTDPYVSYIVKYDNNFNPVHSKKLSTAHPEHAWQWNIFCKNSHVYLPTTYTTDNTTFLNQTFQQNEGTIFQLDQNLEITNKYSLTSNNNMGFSKCLGAQVDDAGGVYITFSYNGSYVDETTFTGNGFSLNANNILLKYNENGSIAWFKNINNEIGGKNIKFFKPNYNFYSGINTFIVADSKFTIPFEFSNFSPDISLYWGDVSIDTNNTHPFKILQLDLNGNELEYGYHCNTTLISADFTAIPTSVSPGESVSFTDNSTGNPNSWSWDFGDGGTSSLQNPTHTFTTEGTYTVKLTVSGILGSDTKTKNGYIVVSSSSSTAEITNFIGNKEIILTSEGGFISGNNEYGDLAKADYFDNYSSYAFITGAKIYFGYATGTNNCSVCVWDNNGVDNSPGTILAKKDIPISQIITDINDDKKTNIVFDDAIQINNPFYMGVLLPTILGDTIAIYTNSSGEAIINTAWEQWEDEEWYTYYDGWGDSFNHDITVILSNQNSLNTNTLIRTLKISPNPFSEGALIEFGNENNSSYTLIIKDIRGKVVKRERNITAKSFLLNRDDWPAGLYHIELIGQNIYCGKVIIN